MWKKTFAVSADIWVIFGWSISAVNEWLLMLSTSLAICCSLIVIVPWIIHKGWQNKKRG